MTPASLPGTDLMLSPLIYGTADWATLEEGLLERLYTAFRSAGGNAFDTAHCYSFWVDKLGEPERQLGRLIRRLEKRRGDVAVISKGGHTPGGDKYPRPDFYLSPEAVRKDLTESLERLETGPIDLYLLHRDDPRVPASEHLHMLQEALAKGWVRHIGVSNWRPERVEEAMEAARREGWQGFVCNEVMHNLAQLSEGRKGDPTIPPVDEATLAWYGRTGFPMLAFSATANGYFATGKSRWGNNDNPASEARRARAAELGAQKGATAAQVALACLRAHPFPCFPIFSTRDLTRLREIVDSADLHLTAREAEWVRHGHEMSHS